MNSAIVALAVILVLLLAGAAYIASPPVQPPVVTDKGIQAFSSEQDFKAYLQESSMQTGYGYMSAMSAVSGARAFSAETTGALDTGMPAPSAPSAPGVTEPGRVSGTTVQVMGIDEPDIVKTDGRTIYFSSGPGGYRSWDYYYYGGETKVITAFPPESLAELDGIAKQGNLLLHGNTLMVFTYDEIYGYDVTNPGSPTETWKLEVNGSVVGARLYQDKVYLITRDYINQYRPCPVVPVTRNGVPVIVECASIFHPVNPVQTDLTYSAMMINPATGLVEKAVSFVGSSSSSVIYMSPSAIYVTYVYQGDMVEIFYNFMAENPDLFPSHVLERVDKLRGYDISSQSKMMEMGIILQQYIYSLDDDEQLRLQNEMANRMGNYTVKHKRDFVRTGIAKIGLDLSMAGSGSVPGTLLNQFSLDEHENFLRAAVTVGGQWTMLGSGESANDVYVLDSGLNIVGSVLDLGLTERIYSVRFIQDKAYVVTFRQVDPFYVLDMSVPTNPQLRGELKIPGYSSYLHPITKDKILGIGKEGSQVKVSLFDVSNPANPTEADKYMLNEYWSDVLNTHHAFLLDDKHEVFFLPGSKGGYVFSYNGGRLSMVKAVSGISATRAVYIDDYLYVIGSNKIVVLDEISWSKVNELELSGVEYPSPGGIEPMISPPVEIME